MKKTFIPLTLITIAASITISGCSFLDMLYGISDDPPAVVSGDGSTTKQELLYNQKDVSDNNLYSNVDSMPTIGNPHVLVVPIWFSDSDNYVSNKDTELSNINKAIFGTNEDTGWYSVKSFYEEESGGLCVIQGSVADWYNCGYSYYQVESGETVKRIVNNAVNSWKNSHTDIVKDYDYDGNGYIDGVIAIYAGPNYKNSRFGNENVMWAYTTWASNFADKDSPNVEAYIWASYDFMYTNTIYPVKIDTHTYVHETGHLFGLDDYYDYNGQGCWAGGYSMQDLNIGGHDPYSLMALGWAKPYVPTQTSEIIIRPFYSTRDVIMLTPEYTASPFDEYILIEFYSPHGVNYLDSIRKYSQSSPTGSLYSGIRVWHVDSRLIYSTSHRYVNGEDIYTFEKSTHIRKGRNYIVGCTNTTVAGTEEDKYCSKDPTLRNYKLLELIKQNDTGHTKYNSYFDSYSLFGRGSTFSTNYKSYFVNSINKEDIIFNNGLTFNWSFEVTSLSNESATIKVTKLTEQNNG